MTLKKYMLVSGPGIAPGTYVDADVTAGTVVTLRPGVYEDIPANTAGYTFSATTLYLSKVRAVGAGVLAWALARATAPTLARHATVKGSGPPVLQSAR